MMKKTLGEEGEERNYLPYVFSNDFVGEFWELQVDEICDRSHGWK